MAERLRDLHHLADLYGVQTSYVDITGKRQEASPEALLAVLRAMRVDVQSLDDVSDSLRRNERALSQRGVEPVLVCWDGRGVDVDLRLPKDQAQATMQCTLHLESGDVQRSDYNLGDLATLQPHPDEGRDRIAKRFRLPDGLPLGYHRLTLDVGGQQYESLIISAPEKAWSPGTRDWGCFLPLYSLRSEQNWGAGNYSDLEHLAHWLGEMGGRVVGTLPLLPAFLDEQYDPSPYSPVSRLFWSEFYIDVTRVAELQHTPGAQALLQSADVRREIEELRAAELVPYRRLWQLKRRILGMLANTLYEQRGERFDQFEQWLRENPQADDYAAFRAATEKQRRGWPVWPERMRDGQLQPGDYDDEAKRCYLYAQWIAVRELEHQARIASQTGTALYLDLPLGVRGDGYDVWRYRDEFVTTASAGAPPDAVFTKGQDWGFCPLHPEAIRQHHYRHYIDFIRHHLRYARFLRIDHVMQLFRLYFIPHGMKATEGVYVRYRMEEFFAILNLESHRHQVGIIGENLGTVPPEINEAMDRHDIARMYIVQYEFQMDTQRDVLRSVPQSVLASLNTHDMPPFTAWYRGVDIDDRQKMGLMDDAEAAQERQTREHVKQILRDWLSEKGYLQAPPDRAAEAKAVTDALHNYLAASPAELLLINLEDLWGETEPQNRPGTTVEQQPNWQRRAKHLWEEFRSMPEVVEALRAVARLRKQGGT